MRFSGHETFSIREGWLHKGLAMLQQEPTLLTDTYASDYLGVGRNMAKSIRHWLVATGLATQESKKAPLESTEFGSLVAEHDPYFVEPGTLWAIHIHLCNQEHYTTTWYWFFNHFRVSRFDRPLCLENLNRYIARQGVKRAPSPVTLQRDIACLLKSYARELPPPDGDPEDVMECPLTELGLLVHYANSGSYRINEEQKGLPLPLLGYSIAQAFEHGEGGFVDLRLHDAANKAGGPGRAFFLSPEKLYEFVSRAYVGGLGDDLQIASLAGERVIRIRQKEPLEWLRNYYEDTELWNFSA